MRRPSRNRGFTIIELVTVMVIVGVLAITVMPSFSAGTGFQAVTFNEQLRAALRLAQKTAVSHRRLVCATLASTSVTLYIAGTNPAVACGTTTIAGNTGSSTYATSSSATLSPTTTLYFQPAGTISTDLAGSSTANLSITVTGMPAITVQGATGYVY